MGQQHDRTGPTDRPGEAAEAQIAAVLDEQHGNFEYHYRDFYCDCGVKIRVGGHQAHRAAVAQKMREAAARG